VVSLVASAQGSPKFFCSCLVLCITSVLSAGSRHQGQLFDPEFDPDMGLTASNMVLCAPHVIDGLRRCVAAPGAMQGEAP